MLVNVKGRNMFLSGEETQRLKGEIQKDTLHSLEAVRHWIEIAEKPPEESGEPKAHVRRQLSLNTTKLLENLDTYFQVFHGYVDPDELRRAFERNDMGERL